MHTHQRVLLIGTLCAIQSVLADSKTESNAIADDSTVSLRIQKFTAAAATSKYSFVVTRSLDDWRWRVLRYVYRESLAAPGTTGYGACVARPQSKQRRTIK